ncbi:hypothetical protein JOD82_001892 [Paenibacillus sp. 1182]|uniref:hypothetical protein n=1 Tax=Paenibacillus sp. 1182 TaxID=2806565 RepID=UPI001AE1F593|nr:hypothetical protein [Paenibacillus sp. 1182]MBP1308872.1 hypothetical protein [Paenibacillus sp. 1182]
MLFVYDPEGATKKMCEEHPEEETMFVLQIENTAHYLCADCFASVGKLVIDGLS